MKNYFLRFFSLSCIPSLSGAVDEFGGSLELSCIVNAMVMSLGEVPPAPSSAWGLFITEELEWSTEVGWVEAAVLTGLWGGRGDAVPCAGLFAGFLWGDFDDLDEVPAGRDTGAFPRFSADAPRAGWIGWEEP